MFRKISSAAHSFSSLASPPNGKLSYLFTRPPKPTPLNSRNSTSLFTYAENSHDEPKIEVWTARLQKGLQTDCKSGDLTVDEPFRYFHRLVQMEPRFGLYLFNLFVNALAKDKRYHDDVLSLFGKMNSVGLTPNFVTLNILLDCSCKANRIRDAFLVMGRILRKGYSPTIATFNSLIKGLCMGRRVDDAVQLYLTLKKFGCRPNVASWRTLNLGLRLCGLGDTSNALKFHEENASLSCQPGHVCCICSVIDGYCKSGNEYAALKIFSRMRGSGSRLDARVYNSIINGFCCAGDLQAALILFLDMLDRKIQFDGKTYYVMIDIYCLIGATQNCQTGAMERVKWLLDWMIEHGIDLRSEPPVNIYED